MNQHKHSIHMMQPHNTTPFNLIIVNNSFYNSYLCTLKSCDQVSFILMLVFIHASYNKTEHIA